MDKKLLIGMLKDWGLALVIVVGVLFVWNLVQPRVDMSGDPAPDFKLADLQGQEFELKQHRGEVVVLNFWATWCGPCKQEIPAFAKFHDDHPDIPMYGISVDDALTTRQLEAHVKRLGINYTVLHDQYSITAGAYSVSGLPTTIVVGPDGKITAAHAGPLSLSRLERMVLE